MPQRTWWKAEAAQWFQLPEIRHKYSPFVCDVTSFFKTISSISVSGKRMNFIFKICQNVAGIIIISQFTYFLTKFFGGFLPLGPIVGRGLSGPLRISPLRS